MHPFLQLPFYRQKLKLSTVDVEENLKPEGWFFLQVEGSVIETVSSVSLD